MSWQCRSVTQGVANHLEECKEQEIQILDSEVQRLQRCLEASGPHRESPVSSVKDDWLYKRVVAQLESETEQRVELEKQCSTLLTDLQGSKRKLEFCYKKFRGETRGSPPPTPDSSLRIGELCAYDVKQTAECG